MNDLKVISVDDTLMNLILIEEIAREMGVYVESFQDPLEALKHIKNSRVDMMFVDYMMPQMNGLDALPKLLEVNPKAKVLMMTAYSTLDKVLNAHRHGASDYIMKPFSSLDALGTKIKEVLKK